MAFDSLVGLVGLFFVLVSLFGLLFDSTKSGEFLILGIVLFVLGMVLIFSAAYLL